MKIQYLKKEKDYEFVGDCNLTKKLPAGVYRIEHDDFKGFYLKSVKIETEGLINFPNSISENIMDKINIFLTDKIKDKFDKYKMIYKRGILLYGSPGTGKTSIVNQLISLATKKGMIILLNPNPYNVKDVINHVREIESISRPVFVIWEEFETKVENFEDGLLSLLDGVDQINDIVFLATTNYIDQIPDRIKNRPSRFADVIEIGYPDSSVRRKFFEGKIHKDDSIDIEMWTKETEGLSIDHLKDLIISVLVLGIPFDEALDKLRKVDYIDEDKRNDNPEKSNTSPTAVPTNYKKKKYNNISANNQENYSKG